MMDPLSCCSRGAQRLSGIDYEWTMNKLKMNYELKIEPSFLLEGINTDELLFQYM